SVGRLFHCLRRRGIGGDGAFHHGSLLGSRHRWDGASGRLSVAVVVEFGRSFPLQIMNTKTIAKSLYGIFGVIFLLAGAGVFLLDTGLLPGVIKNIIINVGHDDLNTLHIIQEFGSLLVFAGLITFWFIRHYEQSKAYHWAMTTFWGLFALAH